ncbi:uncharacterized protein LOC141856704 isoform X2 [Brevipalpus obovatus]
MKFIERNGKHFDKILNFLRDGSVPLPQAKEKLRELLVEAEYYGIKELIGDIQVELSSIEKKESGLNIPRQVFLNMSSVAGDFSRKHSLPEVRLTIGRYSDSSLFGGTTAKEFASDFESFNHLCERLGHKFMFAKHYEIMQMDGKPTLKWSFIFNGEVFGNITKENDEEFGSTFDDFAEKYVAFTEAQGLSHVPPSGQQSPIEGDPKEHIKLNVGGCKLDSTRGCLTKYQSMLRAMFSGRHNVPADSEGSIRIDRSGKHFPEIHKFFQDESILLPGSKEELCELLAEAEFYQLKELEDLINEKLEWNRGYIPDYPSKIFIVKSPEDKDLWKRSTKPTVNLTIQNIAQAYREGIDGRDPHVLWKHLLHFERFCCFTKGRVQFVQETTIGACCSWIFSLAGEIVAEHNFMIEGRYCFKNYEMHEEMIKFLTRVQEQ